MMTQRFGLRIGIVLAAFVGASIFTMGDAALGREHTGHVTLSIEGMTCARCVKTIRSALRKIPGVEKAEVSLEQKTALVEFKHGEVTSDQLIQAVEGASNAMFQYKASVAIDKATLRIEGMTCSSCVPRVRSALLEVPGVRSAEVHLEKGEASVAFEKGRVAPAQLIEAVEKAGYRASIPAE